MHGTCSDGAYTPGREKTNNFRELKGKQTEMFKKHMKRRLMSLIAREMQIKITARCHFIPIRLTNRCSQIHIAE